MSASPPTVTLDGHLLYTVAGAAEFLDKTEPAVRGLIRSRALPSALHGGRRLIPAEDLAKYRSDTEHMQSVTHSTRRFRPPVRDLGESDDHGSGTPNNGTDIPTQRRPLFTW